MKLIQKEPNPSGAYPPIQEMPVSVLPAGMVLVPEELDDGVFYENNGFVTLTLDGDVVTAMTANTAARAAWLATLPALPAAEPEPEPVATAEEDRDAMLVDHEYRLTLLELGVTEEV